MLINVFMAYHKFDRKVCTSIDMPRVCTQYKSATNYSTISHNDGGDPLLEYVIKLNEIQKAAADGILILLTDVKIV